MLGRYRYSLAPFKKEATESDGWVPFTRGRLTDRVAALRDYKSSFDTVLTWKDRRAFSLEIGLGFLANVDRVDVFATGDVPSCQLLASGSTRGWTRCADVKRAGRTIEVRKLTLNARGRFRFLRVDFGERVQGREFKLVEVDVWGLPNAHASQ